MTRSLIFGSVAAFTFLGFFIPSFILVFNGLVKQAEVASAANTQLYSSTVSTPHPSIIISGKTFFADIADTEASLQLGLSNRQNLPSNHVMLFVFQTPSNWGIWMKDMHFPLDIFWLNATGTVVYLQQNVSPNTYPTIFAPPPSTPAAYVIEANAGTAAELGVHLNSIITIPSNLSFQN